MAQEYARIFAALDGASTQEAVAQRAVTLAADNHAKLMFGHVIDSVPYEASGVDFEALCAEGKKRIEADLADVLAAARQNPDIPSVEVSVHAGRIADTLEHELIEPFEPNLVARSVFCEKKRIARSVGAGRAILVSARRGGGRA